MSNCGEGSVMESVCGAGKALSAKNWRVREGALSLFAAAAGGGARARGGAAAAALASIGADAVLGPAATMLSDAQPGLRQAAADALGALALAIGLPRVTAKVAAAGARPAQLKALKDRYDELSRAADADASPSAAEAGDADAPRAGARRATQTAPSLAGVTGGAGAAASETRVSAAAEMSAGGGRGGYGAAAGGVGAGVEEGGFESAVSAAGGSGGGAAAAAPSLGSPFAGDGSDEPAFSARALPPDQLAVWATHPAVTTLVYLNSGPWWAPGVLGDLGADVGYTVSLGGTSVQTSAAVPLSPLTPSSARELTKFIDEFAATCGGTTGDWKGRVAALEKMRRYVAGGAMGVDAFVAALPRIRDALCAQIADLRSSIVRLACLVIAELSAVGAGGGAIEPLAEALVETLLRLTVVTISVIASSAEACLGSLLHNARAGWPRIIPKLIVAAKARSSVARARAAESLLAVLRGWSPPALERHADEIAGALTALLGDADPHARSAARMA
jgi:hypothetical protein